MKATYLVYDENNQGQLRSATKEEWKSITDANKTLPIEKRRFFIQDNLFDNGIRDCIFIESSKEEYDLWHSEAQRNYRKRKADNVEMRTIDLEAAEGDGTAIVDLIGDEIDWENRMISNIRMQELYHALAAWKPWATELLSFYMNGTQKQITKVVSERHGVSEQLVRRWKRNFEQFVIDFLAK